MNCQEVTGILDEQRFDALDPALRRQVDAHVAVCAECARAWHMQASLAALPDMALPANFPATCRAVVAAGVRINTSRRPRNRVLFGTLTVVAAAAAMLVFLMRPQTATSPERLAPVAVVEPKADVEAAPPAGIVPEEQHAAVSPAGDLEEPSAPTFTVRLIPFEVMTEAKLAGAPEAQRALLLAMAKANTGDPLRVQALQSLNTALVEELRAVPGLTLLESDPKEISPASHHYRLTLVSSTSIGPDGQLAPTNVRYVQTSLDAQELQAGGNGVRRLTAGYSIDLQASCSGAAKDANTSCGDARGVAATMVQALRADVFPPDPSIARALRARFRNESLDPAERFKALGDLVKLQTKTGETGLLRDPALVHAAIDMAASVDAVRRAQLWRSLRGVGDPALIRPMIASLSQDADDVRLAAVEILGADFSGDPRVREALQATALGDTRPLVRAVAARAVSGEEGWRQYVSTSLKDPSLPAAQRVEAFVYYLYPPGPTPATSRNNPDYWQIMKEMLDDSAVRALAEALPKAGKLGGNEGIFLNNFAAQYAKHPAVVDMMLGYLENDPDPRMRRSVVQALAIAHGDEPRVREALTRALNNDPDQGVRDWIRQVAGKKLQPQ